MLKRSITYKGFDDVEVTEDLYFNISKSEMVEMETEVEGGLKNQLEEIIKTQDRKAIIAQFKDIVLRAYGVKSDDGKRFIKSEQIKTEFSQTAAFDALLWEIATNETSMADFINGVMPADLKEAAEKAAAEQAQAQIAAAQAKVDANPQPPTA